MLLDARTLDDGSTLEADLCVVGAGAAGLSSVLPLLDDDVSIVFVERGGDRPESDGSARGAASGTLLGPRNRYLRRTSVQGFGSIGPDRHTSLRPLDAVDLASRSWVAGSGWPMTPAELEPYHRRAASVLALRPPVEPPSSPLPPAAADFFAEWLPFARDTALADALRTDFAADERVRVLLHATATAVDLDPSGDRVRGVTVRCVAGPALTIRSRHVVLAAGAIENARLLLLSDDRRPGGLGNRHGQVGCGFRDQLVLRAGHLMLPGPGPLAPAWTAAGRHVAGSHLVRAVLRPSETLQRRHELLNALVTFEPAAADRGNALAPQIAGLARTTAALAGVDAPAGHHLVLVAIRGEQAAHPDSRLSLREARDRLGRRLPHLVWEVSEHDVWSLRTTARLLGELLGRHHAGRLQYRGGQGVSRRRLQWSGRPAGTTRMSREPEAGVVDLDCRVHDIENLFVAGASVFPTGGCSGPLLTSMALALRLGDHLRARLAGA